MDVVFPMEVPQATENLAAPLENSVDWKWNFVSLVDALLQILLANLHDRCNFTPIVRVKARVNSCNISMAKAFHHLNLFNQQQKMKTWWILKRKKWKLEPLAKLVALHLACSMKPVWQQPQLCPGKELGGCLQSILCLIWFHLKMTSQTIRHHRLVATM